MSEPEDENPKSPLRFAGEVLVNILVLLGVLGPIVLVWLYLYRPLQFSAYIQNQSTYSSLPHDDRARLDYELQLLVRGTLQHQQNNQFSLDQLKSFVEESFPLPTDNPKALEVPEESGENQESEQAEDAE